MLFTLLEKVKEIHLLRKQNYREEQQIFTKEEKSWLRMRQLEKELKNKITSVNEVIKTNEWSFVFVKTAYQEPFIELVNNF